VTKKGATEKKKHKCVRSVEAKRVTMPGSRKGHSGEGEFYRGGPERGRKTLAPEKEERGVGYGGVRASE